MRHKIRAEDDNRQQEEDAGHLEPYDATDATEWAKKTAHTTGNAPTGSSSGMRCRLDSICCVGNGLRLSLIR
jgi:hypothetical protein